MPDYVSARNRARIPSTLVIALSISCFASLIFCCTRKSAIKLSKNTSANFKKLPNSMLNSSTSRISPSSRSNALSSIFACSIYCVASLIRECFTKLEIPPPAKRSYNPHFRAEFILLRASKRLSLALSPALMASPISF